MKTRLYALGLALLCAALAACGGGGGGGGSVTPPGPTSTPAPTPTPTQTPNAAGCVGQPPFTAARRTMSAPRPIASGDQFAYTGSLTQTITESQPCPQPTATTSAAVSVDVSYATGPQATVTETDAYPTQTTSLTTTQTLVSANGALYLSQTNVSDGNGNSIDTLYAQNQEIDDLGAGTSWSNDPAATVTENLADGSSVTRTIASDGSYTDTQTYANAVKDTISVNGAAASTTLDGSGLYDLAAGSQCAGSGEVKFAYAAPSGGNITLNITSYGLNSSNACVSSSKTRTFPAWFTVPSASGSYITDTFVDSGAGAFGANCSVPGAIATSANSIATETYKQIDPVLGYIETRTTTTYDVNGYGPACVTIVDELDSYYDYADNTTRIDYQSTNGQPDSTDIIDETLNVQSGACGAGGSAPCAAARRIQAVSPVALAARIAAITDYRALQRRQRLQALHAFASHFAHGEVRR